MEFVYVIRKVNKSRPQPAQKILASAEFLTFASHVARHIQLCVNSTALRLASARFSESSVHVRVVLSIYVHEAASALLSQVTKIATHSCFHSR